MKNTLGENWNSEKILNPKTLKSMSDITVINNEVNDILSNTSDNSDYWKYIWEVRYDSEIDDFEELKSRIFEAIKINVDFYWDFEDFKINFNFVYSRKDMDKLYWKETADWLVWNWGWESGPITIFSEKVFDQESCHPKSDFFPVLVHELSHKFSRREFWKIRGRFLSEWICWLVAKQYLTRKPNWRSRFEELYYNTWDQDPNYDQAYFFIKYLFEEFWKEKLIELYANNSESNTFEDFKLIFKNVYNIWFEDIEAKWKKTLVK